MDLAVNLPHHIATFGGVLLLTASHMISQLLKCTGISPHLLMLLHGPKNRSLLLFWQPLVTLTSLSTSIGPYLKQQQVRYAHILPIVVTDNPILGVTLRVTLCLIHRFTVDSTIQGGEGKGGKQYRQFS